MRHKMSFHHTSPPPAITQHTSLVFLGLVSPLTISGSVATMLSGVIPAARAIEFRDETPKALAELAAANTTAALRTTLIFILQ